MSSFDLSKVGLTNDEIYTQAEMSVIMQALSGTQGMVARINDVIAVLDRRRQVIVEKRAAALQNIDRYKVALAPHRKLPKEILGQIFKQCAMGREAPPYFARLYPRSLVVIFPWLQHYPLLHVCSMWRQVASDTPQLWNDITLIEPQDSAALRIAQRLLSRAGGLSISLTIDWSTSGVDVNKGFEELMNHHRFESLDINLQSQHLPQLSQLPQNLASNVKKLNAIVYSDNAHSNDTHLSLPSEHFPQLESFRMHAVVIDHLVLPWTQHRHLDLASTMLPWELCSGILPQCTSVEECFLSLYGRSPHLVSDISLPLLQRLSLTSVRGAASFCNIMQPLITPQLTTLGLRGVALGCSNYNSVVQRNNLGQLQVLRLASVSDSSNIHRFLCNTPSLHTIQLPYLRGDFDPKALEGLSDGQLASFFRP